MTFRRPLAILLCAVALASCEKNGFKQLTGPLPGSSVKFFNFGVNAPQVNFFANDTKLTAVGSSDTTGLESPKGTAYGAAAAGGYYTAIDPGQYTLSGRISDTASADRGLAISNLQATFEDGKYYSFYQSGMYDSTAKTVDAFIVEDPIPQPIDYTVAYVRFVNAISNSSPMTLFATSTDSATAGQTTAIGGSVAYKSAGDFTAIPGGVYNLATRLDGASTDAITRKSVSLSAGHVYTVSALGDMTVTTAGAANLPKLDRTANW